MLALTNLSTFGVPYAISVTALVVFLAWILADASFDCAMDLALKDLRIGPFDGVDTILAETCSLLRWALLLAGGAILSGCDGPRTATQNPPSRVSPAKPGTLPTLNRPVEPYRVVRVWDENAWQKRLAGWVLAPERPDPSRGRWTPELTNTLRGDTAEVLFLDDVPLTEEIRSLVMPLKKVRRLSVSANATATDLSWIAQMKQLCGLELPFADLTGADLRVLASLPELEFLSLCCAELTANDFRSLPRLEKLQSLWLRGTNVSDEFVDHVVHGELPALRSLGLTASSVTDKGIAQLCSVYDLECLSICQSRQISARSIPAISRMKKLRRLEIWETGIVQGAVINDDVRRLQKLLPDCTICFAD